MITRRVILLLLLIPFDGFSEIVRVKGYAQELAGMVINLSVNSDPIKVKYVKLDSDTIDTDGYFELESDIQQICKATIRVNRFSSVIYLTPGKEYEIEIPKSKLFILIWSWNSGELVYNFENLDSADVNAEILTFNESYYSFFDTYAHLVGTRALRNEVEKFENEYRVFNNTFASEYAKYSIAEMKMVAGFSKDSLYAQYFKTSKLNFSNPAMERFFFLFYDEKFSRFNPLAEEKLKNLKEPLSFNKLNSLLKEHAYLENRDVRHWYALNLLELYAFFGDAELDKKIVEILKEFETTALDPMLEKSITKTRLSILKPKKENFFDIYPKVEELITSTTKPSLLLVSLGKSKERDKEAQVIDELLIKYGDLFQVVELTIGGNQRTPATWPVGDILSAEDFLRDLLIFQLPWYGWMETDGTFVGDLEKPSIFLEKKLFSLRAKEREKNKIKVGQ